MICFPSQVLPLIAFSSVFFSFLVLLHHLQLRSPLGVSERELQT